MQKQKRNRTFTKQETQTKQTKVGMETRTSILENATPLVCKRQPASRHLMIDSLYVRRGSQGR